MISKFVTTYLLKINRQYGKIKVYNLAKITGVLLLCSCAAASAAPIFLTDWLGSDIGQGTDFVALGTITTSTSTVNVTYTNALQFAGNQTLLFSQTIVNPMFSYVSIDGKDLAALNEDGWLALISERRVGIPPGIDGADDADKARRYARSLATAVGRRVGIPPGIDGADDARRGYAFLNQDFEILSYGAGLGSRNVVDLGGGNFEYQLLGMGEPYGTIRFTGAFDALNWRSLSNEFGDVVTVGVQGTAAEVLPPAPGRVPEPATLLLLSLGLAGLALNRRKHTAYLLDA